MGKVIRESDIVKQITHALYDMGVVYIIKMHGDQYQSNGAPDLVIVEPTTGRFVGLEAKRPGGKATMLQLDALGKINGSGGYGAIVNSVDEAMQAILHVRCGMDCRLVIAGKHEAARHSDYRFVCGIRDALPEQKGFNVYEIVKEGNK